MRGRTSPAQIDTGFSSVATGGYHTMGVKTDGTLWAWGNDTYGELGDGGGNWTVPLQIP
jgi:alpha-tubulin suppressor-like RCC1 family protein